ncbi:hypothetical protein [Altericroceibacterium endophyticum]|uniref:Uncharacterized protein n=1 Tax=Altericroceibacterium endophyticum TaxID=1808508 RepID=A0A6I4TA19_9SPHN|nr:hypothetical protein [Altericroceibacterium endophyticum]MXO66720.1 hypothetical protein [Altericroceibacterium endophyticum]
MDLQRARFPSVTLRDHDLKERIDRMMLARSAGSTFAAQPDKVADARLALDGRS